MLSLVSHLKEDIHSFPMIYNMPYIDKETINIGVGQEWQDTIPEMVPQHSCYQQMKPRHLGLTSSLT